MKNIFAACLLIGSLTSFSQELSIKKGKFYSGDALVTPADFVEQMKGNDEAYQLALKGKSGYSASNVLGFIGGFMIGWPLGTAIGGGDANWTLAGIGAGVLAIAIPIQSGAKKKLQAAAYLHNGNSSSASVLRLDVLPNGVGFTFSF